MPATYEVPAIRRATEIMRLLALSLAPMTATELLQATGISRSTLYLLLDSLEHRRWIERRGGGYIIGVQLFEIGSAYLRYDRLQQAFRDEAPAFVAKHNEVVQLAVLEGGDVVYIGREDAQRPVRLVSDAGTRLPAHCCALGKALLASLADEQVLAVLPPKLEALTRHTITQPAKLIEELKEVRRTGIARDREEVAAGLHCFSAYVGQTAAGRRVAVSSSVPVDRLTKQREREIVVSVVQLAGRIGSRLRGAGSA
ncbi:MAG: IclR family transcriptional regulator [Pusillimonas sp.]